MLQKYIGLQCRECVNRKKREYKQRTHDQSLERQRRYRELHREEIEARRKEWDAKRRSQMTPEQLLEHKAHLAKIVRDGHERLREQTFAAYGGWKCACCGETQRDFLTIDHINNDGGKLRKAGTYGKQGVGGIFMYRWLRKNGFPEGFQVLCMNCQVGKARNKGVCPHQVSSNDYPVMGVGSSDPKRGVSTSLH